MKIQKNDIESYVSLPNGAVIKVRKSAPHGQMFLIEDGETLISPRVYPTDDVEKALPFVEKNAPQRCPYCTSRECLKNMLVKNGYDLYMNPQPSIYNPKGIRKKIKGYAVYPYECLKWKLRFVVERVRIFFYFSISNFDGYCPRCHAASIKEITRKQSPVNKFTNNTVGFPMNSHEDNGWQEKHDYHFECDRCGESFEIHIY